MADIVVVIHLLFVGFAVAGGLLVLRWRWAAWLHVPAFVWASAIEFSGGVCPLTPLENRLRADAGTTIYSNDFITHYIMPVLYPAGLTRDLQVVFGSIVLLINIGVYGYLLYRRWRSVREVG